MDDRAYLRSITGGNNGRNWWKHAALNTAAGLAAAGTVGLLSQQNFTKFREAVKRSGRFSEFSPEKKMRNTTSVSKYNFRGRRRTMSSAGNKKRSVSRKRAMSLSAVRLPSVSRMPSSSYMDIVKNRGKGFGTGVLRGKFRLPRRQKLDKLSKFLKKGAVSKTETSDTLEDGNCVYIGHTTFIQEEILKNFCRAVVKKLYNQADIYFTDFEDTNSAITRLAIRYQVGADENQISAHNIDYTNPAVPFTFEEMAIDLYTWVRSQFLGSATTTERAKVIQGFRLFVGDVGTAGFNNIIAEIRGAMTVEWYVRSILKVQNRTRSVLGTEADQVDRIPLIGKSYEINKCGFEQSSIFSNNTVAGFYSDPDTGIIAMESANIQQQVFKEPPMANVFKSNVKQGGVKLGPGVIKYSTLTTHSKMELGVFLQQVYGTIPQANFFNYGKSRMFAMEKPINLEEENLIKIGYEHQYEVGIAVGVKKAITRAVIVV